MSLLYYSGFFIFGSLILVAIYVVFEKFLDMLSNTFISPISKRKWRMALLGGSIGSMLVVFLTAHYELWHLWQKLAFAKFGIPQTSFFAENMNTYINFFTNDLVLHAGVAGYVFGWIVFYIVFGILVAPNADDKEIIRGSQLVDGESLKKSIATELSQNNELSRLFFGKENIPLPYNEEPRSCLILGKPGSGKTQFVLWLLSQIETFKEAIIFYDRKEDFWTRFYRPEKDHIFYPQHPNTIKWNIFEDINDFSDVLFYAEAIIPKNPEKKDSHWDDQARVVLVATLLAVCDENYNSTNKKLIEFIHKNASKEFLMNRLKNNEMVIKHGYQGRVFGALTDDKQGDSVFASLNPYFDEITKPEFYHDESTFVVKKYVRANMSENIDSRLFLVHPNEKDASYRTYFRLFLNVILRNLLKLREQEGRRIHLVLDEFNSLGKIKELEATPEVSRYIGVCMFLISQSLAKIKENYGENLRDSLFQLLSTKVIFQYDEPSGTRYLSDYLGDQEAREFSNNRMMALEGTKDLSQFQERVTSKKTFLSSQFGQLSVKYGEVEGIVKISHYPISKFRLETKAYPRQHDVLDDESSVKYPLFDYLLKKDKEPDDKDETKKNKSKENEKAAPSMEAHDLAFDGEDAVSETSFFGFDDELEHGRDI